MRRRPPHIVVTTPESLYILMGSASGRAMLASTRTVIVDEIHAMAASKRGAHLALTLERLEALAGRRLTRIGLSATQKPIEDVARFLVGTRNLAADGRAACAVIDAGHVRARDLQLEIPASPLEAVMSGEVWTQVYDRLAQLVSEHRTTLVFVNTRRQAERLARHLSERLGEEHVTAHHGSLAKESRLDAEQRLKRGAAARAGGDRLARARHRHRRSRPGLPARARRARSPPSCSASGARATASAARPRDGCSRCRAMTWWSARRCIDCGAPR